MDDIINIKKTEDASMKNEIKITNIADIENLEGCIMYENIETGEQFDKADLLYFYDGQELTLFEV